MANSIGRNQNVNDTSVVTTVTINSVTATKLLDPNPNRLWVRISLPFGTSDIACMIREYAASIDNIKHGEILQRHTLGNENLFKPCYYTFGDNVYTGEISAISDSGSFDLHITEG